MGMEMSFFSISAEDGESILAHPERLGHVLGHPPLPYKPGFFARLFGAKESPPDAWRPGPIENLDIDKAWDGLNFLLTHKMPAEVNDPNKVLCFMEWEPLTRQYDAAVLLTNSQVQAISQVLAAVKPQQLYELADPADLKANGIYPDIWDDPKEVCIGYIIEALIDIKAFFERAAVNHQAIAFDCK